MKRTLTALVLSVLVFVTIGGIGYAGEGDLINNGIKGGLHDGYMSTCVPNIQTQSSQYGLGYERSQVVDYCACLSTKMFQNMTNKQYEYFIMNSFRLPPEMEALREGWRYQCGSHLD